MRVVIADDSSIPRNYLRGILMRAGHDVVAAAANGKEAVELCREHKPDVVVLDNSMPIMTGGEAAEQIRKDESATHIIMASADTQAAIVAPLRAKGFGFVGKPYEDEQLIAALQELTR